MNDGSNTTSMNGAPPVSMAMSGQQQQQGTTTTTSTTDLNAVGESPRVVEGDASRGLKSLLYWGVQNAKQDQSRNPLTSTMNNNSAPAAVPRYNPHPCQLFSSDSRQGSKSSTISSGSSSSCSSHMTTGMQNKPWVPPTSFSVPTEEKRSITKSTCASSVADDQNNGGSNGVNCGNGAQSNWGECTELINSVLGNYTDEEWKAWSGGLTQKEQGKGAGGSGVTPMDIDEL